MSGRELLRRAHIEHEQFPALLQPALQLVMVQLRRRRRLGEGNSGGGQGQCDCEDPAALQGHGCAPAAGQRCGTFCTCVMS